MFPNSSGVLFFGAEGETPVAWNNVFLDTRDLTEEEQNKVYARMRSSQAMTFNCHVGKKDIESLMNIFNPKPFKLAKGPYRKRMIMRARKMQANYISTYTVRKEGDKYVDERGAFRLVLQ